jgi:NAD(P)H-flavin reductase
MSALGNLEFRRGHWFVRVSLPDGTRRRFPLPDDLTPERREELKITISERERRRRARRRGRG